MKMDTSDIDVIITLRILMNGKEIGGIIGKVWYIMLGLDCFVFDKCPFFLRFCCRLFTLLLWLEYETIIPVPLYLIRIKGKL